MPIRQPIIQPLPCDGATVGAIDPTDLDLNYLAISGDLYSLVFVGQSTDTSTSPAFSCKFKGIVGELRSIGIWPGVAAPTSAFTVTLTDEHGRAWVLPSVPVAGNPSIAIDDDIVIQSRYGYLTVSVDDFGAKELDAKFVMQFSRSASGGSSGITVDASGTGSGKVATSRGQTNGTTDVTLFAAPSSNKVKHNLGGTLKNNYSSAVTALIKHSDGSNDREIWQDSIAADYTLNLTAILDGIRLTQTTDLIEVVLTSSPTDECDFVISWDEDSN